jgi:hypothetical protein
MLLKNINICLKIKIAYCMETSVDKNYNLYIKAVNLFNTSVNLTYVAALGTCFLAQLSNMSCPFRLKLIDNGNWSDDNWSNDNWSNESCPIKFSIFCFYLEIFFRSKHSLI